MKRMKTAYTAGLALLGLVLASGCHRDMYDQPKYEPYDQSTFFTDQKADRHPVTGTVARGQLALDDAFYRGAVNGKPVPNIPPAALARFANTRDMLRRGQAQYNTFCQPCHGESGYGNGMIAQRGLSQRRQVPTYHSPRLRDIEDGHFYDVITNGFGVMYPYSSRIAPEDRWAVVAYIRALQLSQNARPSDMPAEARQRLLRGENPNVAPGAAATTGTTSTNE